MLFFFIKTSILLFDFITFQFFSKLKKHLSKTLFSILSDFFYFLEFLKQKNIKKILDTRVNQNEIHVSIFSYNFQDLHVFEEYVIIANIISNQKNTVQHERGWKEKLKWLHFIKKGLDGRAHVVAFLWGCPRCRFVKKKEGKSPTKMNKQTNKQHNRRERSWLSSLISQFETVGSIKLSKYCWHKSNRLEKIS